MAEISNETGTNVLTSYTYDDNGNLLSQLNVDNTAVVTHSYDGFNRLISSVTGEGTITYTYNAQGIRTSRTVGVTTTNYLLDGGNVIGEVTGNITTTYLRGVNLISGSGKFYLYDAHGDVVQLTDSTGTVTKTYSYDAFGNEQNPDEEDTNPFRYCGEYYDTETGLYYLRARYYDPLIGRFTQEDTHWNTVNMIYGDNPQKINEREDALGLKHYSYAPQLSAVVQSGNLYVYCTNSPILYADPSGELAFPGQIHNMVVKHVANKFGFSTEQIILYGKGGWGRADLIDYETGQVWDVKRDKPRQIKAGEDQVSKYVENTWKRHPDRSLQVGQSLPSGFFVTEIGIHTYIVTYRYAGKGVIAYDYDKVTNWMKVGETTLGIVLIAGVAFVIVLATGGSGAPALIALLP